MRILFLISVLTVSVLPAVRAAGDSLLLHFISKAGDRVLQAGDTCRNAFGETLRVRQFSYYISHIQVAGAEKQFVPVSDSCYLVTLQEENSHHISLPLPVPGGIRYLRFLLGVDSSKNVTGVQTGTLDPARGMFWTWNSGYVMARLEGKSTASTAPGNNFTYHVGGYKPGEAAARWVELAISQPRKELYIAADALKWFKGSNDIRVSAHPVCHEPGKLAMQLADNYATMFSLIQAP
jgi:hypothetical protein